MAVNRKLIAAGHKRVCHLLTKYLPDLPSVARDTSVGTAHKILSATFQYASVKDGALGVNQALVHAGYTRKLSRAPNGGTRVSLTLITTEDDSAYVSAVHLTLHQSTGLFSLVIETRAG